MSRRTVEAGFERPTQTRIEHPFALRAPTLIDGAPIWDLIRRSKPLDENSCYAYLLLCQHFADTCVVAERGGAVIGFISAYLPPHNGETVFVWQVAVDHRMRGMGVANAMLMHLLARRACVRVRFLETTVSPGNTASMTLFQRLANRLETNCVERPLFTCDLFAGQDHEDEVLLRIGPLQPLGVGPGEVNESGDSRENVYGE